MRFMCACFLIMLMSAVSAFAQQTSSTQHGNPAYDLWLIRSQTIAEELIKDATDLTPPERALLWAKLGQLWWRHNPEKARLWILKAVEIVEDVPNRENPDERRRRLTAARSVLQIVASLDQDTSKKLISILNESAEHEAADNEQAANADALIEAAIALVNKDPQRAAEMGELALRTGRPRDIASLIFALRGKDKQLSDALFAQALVAAQQTLAAELLHSLTFAAFPAESHIRTNIAGPPEGLRRELLKIDVAYLEANQITPESRNSVCAGVISFIVPVLAQLDRLLTERAAFARQFVNQCQSISPIAQQRVDDTLRDQPVRTIDDLLKAADDAQDLKVRTVYQYRAAALAKERKDYDRALKILDSMSKEAREFMGGSWEAHRWDWAALSALNHFKNGEIYEMRLVMKAVPTDLQPLAKMAFVDRLPNNRDKDTDPTLEFLSDARMGLRRQSLSDGEKSVGYFGLLPLTLKYQPTEATGVLKEAVAALNRAEQTKDKNTRNNDRSSLSGAEFSKLFPASLLEMDEYAVKEAVSSITSPDIRVQVRLGLLSICLERLGGAKQATPKQAPSASKGV